MANQIFLTEVFKRYLIQNRPTNAITLSQKLTRREHQVAKLILEGEKLTAIGKSLHLKVSTISTVKARINKKLGVKNLIELNDFTKSSIMANK